MRTRIVLVALIVSTVAAGTAAASTWGGTPRAGSWKGKVVHGGSIRFHVFKGGHHVGRFTIKVPYSCLGDGNKVTERGTLTIRRHASVKVSGESGYFREWDPKVVVPGHHGRKVQVRVTGGFSAHHPIPPPATRATGVVEASWLEGPDNGTECMPGKYPDADWSAKLR